LITGVQAPNQNIIVENCYLFNEGIFINAILDSTLLNIRSSKTITSTGLICISIVYNVNALQSNILLANPTLYQTISPNDNNQYCLYNGSIQQIQSLTPVITVITLSGPATFTGTFQCIKYGRQVTLIDVGQLTTTSTSPTRVIGQLSPNCYPIVATQMNYISLPAGSSLKLFCININTDGSLSIFAVCASGDKFMFISTTFISAT
jgi:hypothetical protein